jgi:hypothetical protein
VCFICKRPRAGIESYIIPEISNLFWRQPAAQCGDLTKHFYQTLPKDLNIDHVYLATLCEREVRNQLILALGAPSWNWCQHVKRCVVRTNLLHIFLLLIYHSNYGTLGKIEMVSYHSQVGLLTNICRKPQHSHSHKLAYSHSPKTWECEYIRT